MNKEFADKVREFNRFYTNIIGLLDGHILNSNYSLPEARIIYEIYHHQNCSASDVISALQIDKSYLSRILQKLEREKIIVKTRDEEDGRSVRLMLTTKGEKAFEQLNEASNRQIDGLLSTLPDAAKEKMADHMSAIMDILHKTDSDKP